MLQMGRLRTLSSPVKWPTGAANQRSILGIQAVAGLLSELSALVAFLRWEALIKDMMQVKSSFLGQKVQVQARGNQASVSRGQLQVRYIFCT